MGEHRECGLCGRETLPDGDCYGCEGDRVHTRLKVLEVYLETECSDLCAPQADQPYAVEEAVPHVVATFRAHIKKLEGALKYETDIVHVDRDAEVARLELRVTEREDEMLQWKQREALACTHIKDLERRNVQLQARLDAYPGEGDDCG